MNPNIQFFTEETGTEIPGSEKIQSTLCQIVEDHDFALKGIHVITLHDEALKTINKEFLDHDYFTDVISFDLAEEANEVEGEIYLSVDRIQENAEHYGVGFEEELHRIMIHGTLHLVGYTDGTDEEKSQMHSLENHYLNLKSSKKD